MFDYLMPIAAAAAALGVELNVRRDRRCFVLWLFSNAVQVAFAAWIYMQTRESGALWNAGLFSYYLAQALRGLRSWKREQEMSDS